MVPVMSMIEFNLEHRKCYQQDDWERDKIGELSPGTSKICCVVNFFRIKFFIFLADLWFNFKSWFIDMARDPKAARTESRKNTLRCFPEHFYYFVEMCFSCSSYKHPFNAIVQFLSYDHFIVQNLIGSSTREQ